MERTYDISEVCRMLGTTSRTLRFYEEKGIISRTIEPFKTRRQYTREQVEQIRRVLVLRTIGLSVAQISELQRGSVDLSAAILERRARIYAMLDERLREIHLLNDALAMIGEGKDVYARDFEAPYIRGDEKMKDVVRACAKAVVFGETQVLYRYLSDKLIEYMPPEAYERVREDTFLPAGEFISFGKQFCDEKYPNIWYQIVKCDIVDIKIKLVFYGEKVSGLWLLYCED